MFSIAAGTGAAMIMAIARKELISLLFGPAFAPSAALAGPLLFAIPIEFGTSVLLTVLVGMGSPAASNHCDRNRCGSQCVTRTCFLFRDTGREAPRLQHHFPTFRFFSSWCGSCIMGRDPTVEANYGSRAVCSDLNS